MDIVERLRKRANQWLSFGWGNNDIFDEAADEIERLRKDYALSWENHLLHEQIFVLMEAKVERLENIQGRLIGSFRANMMRLNPEYNHEGFDEVIAALKEGE